ncbi:hypothetical protein APASM_3743 [Actinosynnema pretiosum subsp. pretiosum]|nr:hypothetical protein APASM_3743 [Actinosynnema pretiosum subsp. pretiosum]
MREPAAEMSGNRVKKLFGGALVRISSPHFRAFAGGAGRGGGRWSGDARGALTSGTDPAARAGGGGWWRGLVAGVIALAVAGGRWGRPRGLGVVGGLVGDRAGARWERGRVRRRTWRPGTRARSWPPPRATPPPPPASRSRPRGGSGPLPGPFDDLHLLGWLFGPSAQGAAP